MNQKWFIIGWISSTVLFILVVLGIQQRYVQKDIVAKLNDISAQVVPQKKVELSQDSIVRAALPLFFADPSFNMGIAKMPKEFPAYTNPTTDSGISMNIEEFSDYFKKVFKKSDADQVIITAVQTEDPKILRWHIKIHERVK